MDSVGDMYYNSALISTAHASGVSTGVPPTLLPSGRLEFHFRNSDVEAGVEPEVPTVAASFARSHVNVIASEIRLHVANSPTRP